MPVTAEAARTMILALPEVVESKAYGMPCFRVGKKFLMLLRDADSVLALPMSKDERDLRIELEPEVFFITDHYRTSAYVLVRLAAIDADRLAALVEAAWRRAAPRRLVADFDRARRPT